MLLSTRDGYCGQCGRLRHKQGEPINLEHCPCTEGKRITGVPFCVFCGSLYHYPTPCESQPHLRDFWKRGDVVMAIQPIRKPRKRTQENQLLLF